MAPTMEERLAARIPWQDPAAALGAGERAALALHRRGGDTAALVRAGVPRNPCTALLLARRLTAQGLLAEGMEAEIAAFCRPLPTVEGGPGSLCAALLALGLPGEAGRALTLCLPADAPFDEPAAALIQRLRALLVAGGGDTLAIQAELLALCYQVFPRAWNEQMLYQYDTQLPTGGRCPAALARLAAQAAKDRAFRYLNNLFALLVDLSPADAGLDPAALTEAAFSVDDPELFRALLFGFKALCGQRGEEAALEAWWQLLRRHWDAPNLHWRQLRGWFTLYYVSRHIQREPSQAQAWMDRCPQLPPPPPDGLYHKTNRVVQKTVNALLFTPGEGLLAYLRWCEAYNPFRFQPGEERLPYVCLDLHADLEAAFRFQQEQGRSAAELVGLYMNTHARCRMPLHRLGRILRTDPSLTPNAYGTPDVTDLFGAYILRGTIVRENGACLIRPASLLAGGNGLLQVPPDWVNNHKALMDNVLTAGTAVNFVVFRIYQASGRLYVKPLFDQKQNAEAVTLSRQGVDEFCARMKQIAATGRFSTEDNQQIAQIALPPALNRDQFLRLELQEVACCAALLPTPGAARYFVLMLCRLHRGRANRYRFPCQTDSQHTSSRVPSPLFKSCRILWQTIRTLRPDREELFYVYINTPFKFCVSFGELVRLYADPGAAAEDLRELLSHPNAYWFAGTVTRRLEAGQSPLGQACWQLAPLEFSAGAPGRQDLYLYPLPDPDAPTPDASTLLAFRIREYRPGPRYFVLDEVALFSDRQRIDPRNAFIQALGQAASSVELSPAVRKDLRLPAGLSQSYRAQALPAILQALSLRAEDANAMRELLEALGPRNPWAETEEERTADWSRNSALTALIHRLTRFQDTGTVLQVYFSSVLRVLLPLDRLLGFCRRAGHSLLLLPEQMKGHPLTLRPDGYGWQPVGCRLDSWRFSTLPDPACAAPLTVRVTGFDPDTDTLLVAAQDAGS